MADVADTVELGNSDSENESEVETLENNSNKNLQPLEGGPPVLHGSFSDLTLTKTVADYPWYFLSCKVFFWILALQHE